MTDITSAPAGAGAQSTDGGPPRSLLRVRDLCFTYPKSGRRPAVPALHDINLDIFDVGETVGVVGESGSGKSTLGKTILGQLTPTSGTIEYAGENITGVRSARRRELARELQVVFQDPYGSLNPSRTVGQTLEEPLTATGKWEKAALCTRVAEALERVGLPASAAARYPSQFSGGQRQRIVIARATIGAPRLVVCDEAVSALDLSVQAQILNLLRDLQRDSQLSLLFISHDLAVVRHVSDRIIVIYHGSVMEEGPAAELYERPRHPYTQALLHASPIPDPQVQRWQKQFRRQVVSTNPAAVSGTGCPFLPRCPYGTDACAATKPPLITVGAGHKVACVRHDELPAPAARPALPPPSTPYPTHQSDS
jgi:oligopeptide/dipeptide ABC transporter ATP-binding protein